MLEAGAAGFLAKSEPLEGLVERIRCAAQVGHCCHCLCITPKMVECHITRILDKLGMHTRQEAIV